jgi:hypothetical protein
MDYQKGLYFIELDGQGNAILKREDGAHLEPHPKFLAVEGPPSDFIFEIRVSDPDFGFGPKALEWRDNGVAVPQPDSIQSCLFRRKLTLTVFPPPAVTVEALFDFVLFFNNGKQIEASTAHGDRPLDPTIVEKATEPPGG